ncbi:NAD(P)-dependent oxidoreductase [Pelagibius sp.]|uniref:NAD(P)-dependent oxidoreductase n=1 Tax=Pelagibius sp. TaxID=1931238 RepID=UPI003B507369
MARVLIIGASKGIGLATVKRALAGGHRVRAMARSAGQIGLDHDMLEKIKGDALNAEDVTAALAGIDIVIQALGVRPGPQMIFGPITLFSEATRILVPAMEAAGVRRLLCVTGFGAGDSRAAIGCLQRLPFRLFLGQAYDDKTVQEAIIKDSALDWTIVRPGVLTKGRETGRYRVLVEPRRWRNGLISRADVADFLVKQVDDDSLLRESPVIVY